MVDPERGCEKGEEQAAIFTTRGCGSVRFQVPLECFPQISGFAPATQQLFMTAPEKRVQRPGFFLRERWIALSNRLFTAITWRESACVINLPGFLFLFNDNPTVRRRRRHGQDGSLF
jgi:hypothetical protein